MPPKRSRSPVRLLAPIALVASAFALFAVISSSGGDGSGGGGSRAGSVGDRPSAPSDNAAQEAPEPKPQKRSYTVELNDSLSSIAEKTGVEVEKIQELNPELDPQSLTVGQKIKLRE